MQTSRRTFAKAIACASLFAKIASAAIKKELHFFYLEKSTEPSRSISSTLQARYPLSKHSDNINDLMGVGDSGLHVAVGPAAFRTLLEASGRIAGANIISLFTSRQVFERLLAEASASLPRSKKVTAIFAETSAASQIQLIVSVFKRPVAVAVLLSERNAHLEVDLKRAAQRHDIELFIEFVKGESDAIRSLSLTNRAAVLLAVPDQQIYSISNVRSILESSYRRGQVVIGFNPSLVQAGALATTYSTIDNVLEQLDDTANALHAGYTPEPSYPVYWRTTFNEQIAKSLNILIPDDARSLSGKPIQR